MVFVSCFSETNTILLGEISATSLIFSARLPVSLEKSCCSFKFWGLISGHVVHGKFAPRCNDIQNPTLRFMHKWVTITLFPRDDPQPVRNDELMILYAIVNKILLSPAKAMVK
jgi:hypothetical protein